MSRWSDEFKSEEIFSKLQSSLNEVENLETSSFSEHDLFEYSRLIKLLKFLNIRMLKSDPEYFSIGSLQRLSAQINEIHTQINLLAQNKSVSHMNNANNTIDQILDKFNLFGVDETVDSIESVSSASEAFKIKAIEAIAGIRSKGKEADENLSALSKSIGQIKSKIDENDAVIERQKSRLDQSIADYQKQFSDAQEQRTEKFAELKQKNADDLTSQQQDFLSKNKELLTRLEEEHDNLLADINSKSDANQEFLERRKKEVDEIFGAIGTTAFAGNFQSTADKEACAANFMRWVALFIMALMIAVSMYTLYFSFTHEDAWPMFAFRIIAVVVLAFPAFYTMSESTKHRERERQNRKVFLELASIDAYLVMLPEGERNKIKGDLSDKFFGLPTAPEIHDNISPNDLLKTFADIVKSIAKGK